VPMLLLALWALRNITVAPLVGLPIVARAFAVDEDAPERFSGTFVAALVAVLALVGVALGVAGSAEPDFALDSYPVRSLEYVADHGLLGSRMLTDDADAGYVILRYAPEQKVFLDDRFDMYPPRLIADFFKVSEGLPGWSRVLDDRRVDVVVWARTGALASELDQSPAWHRVHRDETHAVWVRTG
jgi:hypothetical protein